jgi:BclA C-terminal domain
VKFDTNGILTAGITHTAGTAGIMISNTGDYLITFSISAVEPNQFALFINGTQVPGDVYGSGAGTQQNHGQTIVTLAGGDVLTLRNHSSAAAVTLQTLAGGTQTTVNAAITIEELTNSSG